MRLRVSRQHPQFWPILTRFMDYYSPSWGPDSIFIVVEPQDALTCRSSTLAALADSGLFLGLLLTVLGCVYVSVPTLIVLADSGPFHALLLSVLGS